MRLVALAGFLEFHEHRGAPVALAARQVDDDRLGRVPANPGLDDGAQLEQRACVLGKSWAYMQRSHLHAGSLGTAAIALTLLTVAAGVRLQFARAISLGLGAGGLGYSIFWLWAGTRAPALGSTDIAKESLAWLAMPSSGLVVASTAAVAVLLARVWLRQSSEGGRPA
jgi:hypothetical protein